MFSLSGRMNELDDLAKETAGLREANEQFRQPLRSQIQQDVRRAEALAAAPTADDPAALDEQRRQIEALTSHFKQVTAASVPLGEQSVALDAARQALLEWRTAIGRQFSASLRSLLTRVGITAGVILVLVAISTAWKRATFRYVTDVRRRRQLMLVRRIIVGAAVAVIVIASVVTEFGSLATFAGLITAGVAVALQTVILSGVAYFFFIGRFGVRVGDRVTVNGITGDVIEIGLFRIYLSELAGDGADLHPTGRVVVFSNAVLFQPSAFYKQVPGADFVWHQVALTLPPDADIRAAETRVTEAVDSVVAEYREAVERQNSSIRTRLHIPMEAPQTISRLHFVNGGVELVVRYPVNLRRAPQIDDRITRTLLEALAKEPKVQFVRAASVV
jgi:small-conductance mechanosensitive channel